MNHLWIPTIALVAATSLAPVAHTGGDRLVETAAASGTAAPAPNVTHSSTLWVKKKSEATGGYEISEHRGLRTIRLTDDFTSSDAPDLKIALSPLTPEKTTNKNALDGAVILGALRGSSGGDVFQVPADTDLARFRSVIVYCESFSLLWCAAPLAEGEVVASDTEWSNGKSAIRGTYEIARVPGGLEVRLSDDFHAEKAPDLKLILSPRQTRQVTNRNAMRDGVILGELPKSDYAGARVRYSGDLDLAKFRSLLIHCESFSIYWGGADLSL